MLRSLPKYRGFDWERGRQDGYADTIESALYLINREPVHEAIDWIETEMPALLAFQKEDGLVEGAEVGQHETGKNHEKRAAHEEALDCELARQEHRNAHQHDEKSPRASVSRQG